MSDTKNRLVRAAREAVEMAKAKPGQTLIKTVRMRPKGKREPYGDGYTHEAMHTTWVLLETFENHVMNSRTTAEFPDVAAQAEVVHQAMSDLYQIIGDKWS